MKTKTKKEKHYIINESDICNLLDCQEAYLHSSACQDTVQVLDGCSMKRDGSNRLCLHRVQNNTVQETHQWTHSYPTSKPKTSTSIDIVNLHEAERERGIKKGERGREREKEKGRERGEREKKRKRERERERE